MRNTDINSIGWAIANPVRLAVLQVLAVRKVADLPGSEPVSELAALTGFKVPTTRFAVRDLLRAGILRSDPIPGSPVFQAERRKYSIAEPKIIEILNLLKNEPRREIQ